MKYLKPLSAGKLGLFVAAMLISMPSWAATVNVSPGGEYKLSNSDLIALPVKMKDGNNDGLVTAGKRSDQSGTFKYGRKNFTVLNSVTLKFIGLCENSFCYGLSSYAPPAPAPKASALMGVNLGGGEANSANMPGKLYWNYVYPKAAHVDLAHSKGVRLFRVPIREDRAQDGFNGPLRPEVAANIYPVIDYILKKSPDTVVLIDWHSFGSRKKIPYGTAPWDAAAIVDLNKKFFAPYNGNDRVIIGLQNEPKNAKANWWPAAQSVVSGLRAAKVTNPISVAGAGYSAAGGWAKTNGPEAAKFVDPMRKTMFEAHTYFDTWSSGTESGCKTGTEVRVDPVIKHAEANGYKIILGEFGMGNSATCQAILTKVVGKLKASPAVYGATWWVMGDFYPYPKYIYGLTGLVKNTPSVLFDSYEANWKAK